MTKFKSKSLNPSKFTDKQIAENSTVVRFVSFEAAIEMFHRSYGIKPPDNVAKGYNITDQGIEIVYE